MMKQSNQLFGLAPEPFNLPQRKANGKEPSSPPDARGPLRRVAPDLFRTLAARYGELLERTVDQRVYARESALTEGLREMSVRLGRLQAAPRDVIDLHSHALEVQLAAAPARLAAVYVEEGRLLVLELMGHLLSYYRRECLQAGRSSERSLRR